MVAVLGGEQAEQLGSGAEAAQGAGHVDALAAGAGEDAVRPGDGAGLEGLDPQGAVEAEVRRDHQHRPSSRQRCQNRHVSVASATGDAYDGGRLTTLSTLHADYFRGLA